MEQEIGAYSHNFMPLGDGDERPAAAAANSIFSELKFLSLQLLDLIQNPTRSNPSNSALSQLLQLLRRSPPHALQPLFDYTLFPLLLLLDASVECRSPPKLEQEGQFGLNNILKSPHKVSDAVAEATLQCLEELLKKCHLSSVNQMVLVLKKLTQGALLTPMEASEEFREGVIRCFRALLFGLGSCSYRTCSCKQVNSYPMLLEKRVGQSPVTDFSMYDSEEQECLLAFLQSQAASAAVGHWLSLLLKAADVEATRGQRGSAKLRVEAFMTLRVLVAKVGRADALAFFLPGVVSQFAKVLHVSKSMISGAAGSAEAMDQAIRGLAEFLMIVLEDSANISSVPMEDITGLSSGKDTSPLSFLEELRHLPLKKDPNKMSVDDSIGGEVDRYALNPGFNEKGEINSENLRSLHVDRTEDWIITTTTHVDKLLGATFPHHSVNLAKKVRRGLLAAIQGLLLKCCYTLKGSRLMLLECLCVLVCDDSEELAAAAQIFLKHLLFSTDKHFVKHDLAEIFGRLVEKLPNVVFGSDETLALSHARKLLVIIYFSGPHLVADYLLQSPVAAARFLDVFALCLSQNSVYAGSLGKRSLAKPSSAGYLHSITEMEPRNFITNDHMALDAATSDKTFPGTQNRRILPQMEYIQSEYCLPRMPPWFVFGSKKLYEVLAGILRLVGLSLIADSRSAGSLSVVIDIPLGHMRQLVSEVRVKEHRKESWQSWYHRTGSGQLVRQASTAACILNEMIFGLSDPAVDAFANMFQIPSSKGPENDLECNGMHPYKLEHFDSDTSVWKVCQERTARSQLIDCIGNILHDYLSSEVWNLPVEHGYFFQQSESEDGDITLHLFLDNAMLQQIIVDGIGIFNMCLGKDFSSSGFLQSSLYVLLENLICSNFQIKNASDTVLRIISATSGHPSVGHLVLANSDYVIDSICRQLRHLDINPQVPNVLAAMLSYIGLAHKILPLLEEPMRSVSLELEVLGRHQHPDLTYPFLKAVAEVTKASKHEACSLPNQAKSYNKHVKSKFSKLEKNQDDCGSLMSHFDKDIQLASVESEMEATQYSSDVGLHVEEWDSILLRLNDLKRYRQTVGSITCSCITAAIPLIASVKQEASLVALDIVEDGIMALSKVEEAHKYDKESREVIEQVLESCSLYNLRDTLDAAEDGSQGNMLLPAMNKVWPFLVACVQSNNPMAVRKCSGVISNVVQICGGDFFSRRFYTDGSHFWKLLTSSPFYKKPFSKNEKAPLQLPYRSSSIYSEDSRAEVSDLKVQISVLNMIADISRNKRSASALEAVLKKVSGLVVGIACSGVTGLRDAAVNALRGLTSMDPDLIWLLLADVYYSLKKKDLPSPPTSDFSEISQILPPASSSKGYLYVHYGGQSFGFDIDFNSVETVFNRLLSEVFG